MGYYQDMLAVHGSKTKAAAFLGIPRTTFLHRLNKEIKDDIPEKISKISLHKITQEIKPASGTMTRVLYFTDAHNMPGLDNTRFKWLGRFVNDVKPDILVDGGDFDDFGSLCSHDRNETYKGKIKPSLARDLEASAESRGILAHEITHPCRKIVTIGNHEDRIWRYENNNPEMYGITSAIYEDILKATGWEFVRYKEYITIAGVDFTHVPFNKSKPYEGENATKQIAGKAQRDTVFGHIHELYHYVDGKLGNQSVTAFCGGCFMPDGYIPDYCKNTRKEFWYGAHVLTIAGCRIKSIKSYHISELEAAYGD